MSRICIVGVGVPSFVPSTAHEGPGLRCGHFTAALARAGHELLVVHVVPGRRSSEARPVSTSREIDGRLVACIEASEGDFGDRRLAELVEAFAPQGVVGVSAYGAALATRLPCEVPLWADVFGDPMAEAQAKALVTGNDLAVARFWAVLRPVIERADRFSAVSRAQSHALVGQLGVFGRLGRATAGERLVSVIPCAAEPCRTDGAAPVKALRGSLVPDDAFVLLWSGSFNTWCDVDTLVRGVASAMERDGSIHLVATGGSVRGHDEHTYPMFRRLVEGSGVGDRFHLLGRLADDALADCYFDSDVGIHIERQLYERRLGSENRVVHWAANGLACVTTAQSELGRCLAARGLCFPCRPGDPDSLAALLVSLAAERCRVAEAGRRVRAFAAEHLSFEATAEPLLRWAAAPEVAGDHGRGRALSVGIVSEPKQMVSLLESYLAELSLAQVFYRSARWIWRRLRRSLPTRHRR